MASSTGIVDSYKQIRAKIINGSLKPGSRLVQEDVARALGLSRVPLREAIKRLEGERLIIGVPRRGVVVPDLSDDTVRDLYVVRLRLEPEAVRQATEVATVDELNGLGARAEALGELRDQAEEFFTADDQLQRAIYGMAPNEVLVDMLLLARDRGEYLRYAYTTRAGDVHRMYARRMAVVSAIRSGIPELAEAATRVDLLEGREALLAWRRRLRDASATAES